MRKEWSTSTLFFWEIICYSFSDSLCRSQCHQREALVTKPFSYAKINYTSVNQACRCWIFLPRAESACDPTWIWVQTRQTKTLRLMDQQQIFSAIYTEAFISQQRIRCEAENARHILKPIITQVTSSLPIMPAFVFHNFLHGELHCQTLGYGKFEPTLAKREAHFSPQFFV